MKQNQTSPKKETKVIFAIYITPIRVILFVTIVINLMRLILAGKGKMQGHSGMIRFHAH